MPSNGSSSRFGNRASIKLVVPKTTSKFNLQLPLLKVFFSFPLLSARNSKVVLPEKTNSQCHKQNTPMTIAVTIVNINVILYNFVFPLVKGVPIV